MTDIVTLQLKYYIRTYDDVVYEEFHITAKQSWYRFRYDEYIGDKLFLYDHVTIPESYIPEPPHIDRTEITVPGFWSHTEMKDRLDYEKYRHIVDRYLLDRIDTQTMAFLHDQTILHDIDIIFDVDWTRIDPPKL